MWVNCQHVHFHICAQTYLVLLENTTTVVVSGCRPLARRLRSNVSMHTRSHRDTHIRRSNFTSCLGAIINIFNQIHYRWCHIRPIRHQCDITSTAHECLMLLCFKQHLRLFLAIIVLLFFIQIIYNLETEAVIH